MMARGVAPAASAVAADADAISAVGWALTPGSASGPAEPGAPLEEGPAAAARQGGGSGGPRCAGLLRGGCHRRASGRAVLQGDGCDPCARNF